MKSLSKIILVGFSAFKGLIMKKNILKNESFISFWTACLGCVIVLAACGLLPGQAHVLSNDSSREVIPFIRMFYRHLLKGESLYYTWDIGLGTGTSITYAFYAYSPVNLIVAFIRNNDLALIVLMACKCGLSALFMSVFLKKCVRLKSCWNIAFSILYAFSNYQFMMFQNICLSDVVWLLPLLITCIFMFVKGEKTALQLSVCYALCFITQFYAGFLTGIFSMFFLIGMIILRKNDMSPKEIKRIILKWLLAVLSAVCVSMLLLWPLLVAYFTNGGSAWNGFSSDRSLDLFSMISSIFWGRGNIWYEETPTLYCGIITILLLPSYFADKRISRKEKMLFGFAIAALMLSFFAEPVYEFWHLFNRPDGYTSRFSILLIFICITIAGREKAFSDSREDNNTKVATRVYEVTAVLMMLITACLYIYWSVTELSSFAHPLRLLVGNIALILAWLLIERLMAGGRRPAAKYLVGLIAVAEAVTAGYYPLNESGKTSSEEAKMITEGMRSATDVILNEGDGFYRANISGGDINQGAVYGFNGVSLFSSENYGDLLFTMFRLGDCVTPFSFSQTGGTDLTDMIFGVKYRGNIGSDLRVNERALPIGYAVTEDIFRLKCEDTGIDPFEVQNAFASALCDNTVVYESLNDISYQTYNNSCVINDDGTGIMENLLNDEPGGIIIGSKDEGYQHAYAFVALVSSQEGDSVGIIEDTPGGDIILCSDNDRCGVGMRNLTSDPAVMEMESDEEGHRLRIIDYDEPGIAFSFAKLCLYGQNEASLDRIYSELNTDKLSMEAMKPGFLRGKIDIPDEKTVLFLTVPYDRCWKAWVDGQPAEIKSAAFDSFCALSLPVGSHEIEMKYEPPGVWLKWVFFVTGIVIWTCMIMRGERNAENR